MSALRRTADELLSLLCALHHACYGKRRMIALARTAATADVQAAVFAGLRKGKQVVLKITSASSFYYKAVRHFGNCSNFREQKSAD